MFGYLFNKKYDKLVDLHIEKNKLLEKENEYLKAQVIKSI